MLKFFANAVRARLCLIALVCFATAEALRAAAPHAPAAPTTQFDDSALIAHLTAVSRDALTHNIDLIKFQKAPLYEVLDYLRTTCGCNITADWRTIDPKTPVSVDFANHTLGEVLKAVCDSAPRHLTYAIVGGDIVLKIDHVDGGAYNAAPTALPASQPVENSSDPANQSTRQELERGLPVIKFQGNSLDDVLEFLGDLTGADIFVDWHALKSAGISKDAEVTVTLRDVQFSTVLNDILHAVGHGKPPMAYIVDDGIIKISTKDRLPNLTDGTVFEVPPAGPPASQPTDAANQKTLQILGRLLPEIKFEGQSLGDVVEFLRDVTGLNIFVDWNALQAAGVSKDSPVTLRLKDAKFSAVLHTLLQSVEDPSKPLVFYAQDGIIKISSKSWFPFIPVDRVYDVHLLVGAGPSPRGEALVKMITSSIDPASWPNAKISLADGKLSVRQSEENQKCIASLLRQLQAFEK